MPENFLQRNEEKTEKDPQNREGWGDTTTNEPFLHISARRTKERDGTGTENGATTTWLTNRQSQKKKNAIQKGTNRSKKQV